MMGSLPVSSLPLNRGQRRWSSSVTPALPARPAQLCASTVGDSAFNTTHLLLPDAPNGAEAGVFTPRLEHLRAAGPHLVAAALSLVGRPVSTAPEGAAYDLVVDDDHRGLLRLQVKTTTRRA